MANKIKGLTVEIGGDTTKLGKALEDVNKKSRSLSTELGDINRLLKLDPGNTDLLAQKQKVLADAIQNTGKKLETLKEAEKQVQAQFEKGEVSEEQVRALQREIIATEKKMDSYSKAAKETEQALKGVGDESKEVTEHSGKLGQALGNAAKVGLQAVAAAATAAVTGLVAAAESTREYRGEMGKLETAFATAGKSSKAATDTYKTLQGVIGETDQSVEAAQQIALLANSEEDAAKWANQAAGVVGRFGDALQPETFFEAANETIKLGESTGAYTQMLEGCGYSVEKFNEGLAACNTEEEKQAYMLGITDKLLGDAADKYRENNAEVIRANEANDQWMQSLSGVGGAIEPIITDVKMLGASMLSELVPGVQRLAESFRGLLNGDEGAAAGIGEALGGIITQVLTKVTELAPTLAQAAISLVTSLTTTLISMLPQLITTGVQVIMAIIQGLTQAIPQVVAAIVGMIPQLANALVTGIPQLIMGAVQLLLAIVQAIPQILPPLVAALPSIVLSIINGLVAAIPQLIMGAVQFLTAIIQAIPLMINALIPQVPTIVNAIITGLISCLPALLAGAVQLLNAIIQAIPIIIQALIPQIPTIVNTIINTLLDNLPILLDAAVELFMAIVKAIPQMLGALAGELPTIVNTVLDVLGSLPGQVFDIGCELVRGLWKGIQSLAGWLWDQVSGWVSGIWDGICGFFGIESPSKQMAWAGEMLDEGLAEGIADHANAPARAAQRMTGSVLDAANGGLAFDRQLRSPAVHGGSAFSNALGDSSAMLAKLDLIAERLNHLQVVTETGALVGQIIDKVDGALATRQALHARGV